MADTSARDAAHYNDWVKGSALERLRKINYEFYTGHGREFSSTRQRLQPGVRRLVDRLRGDDSILDLGCGNGALPRELARRGHRGTYLGIDFSPDLVREARERVSGLRAQFVWADLLTLTQARVPEPPLRSDDPSTSSAALSEAHEALQATRWMIVAAFAVLHHIPGLDQRQQLLHAIRHWMEPDGLLFLSNWRFLDHPRMRSRIRPWQVAGLDSGDLEANDYLLDWRHGTIGFRYAHQFDEPELRDLATACGFTVLETFYSDGADHRSGLYQVWQPTAGAGRG
jgi:tRNA (uracil-5-)-methyltransferase TRM9